MTMKHNTGYDRYIEFNNPLPLPGQRIDDFYIEDIAERFTFIQNELGLKDIVFANLLKSTSAGVLKLKTGQACPSSRTLYQLHEVFGVDLNWFLYGDTSAWREVMSGLYTLPEADLLDIFLRLNCYYLNDDKNALLHSPEMKKTSYSHIPNGIFLKEFPSPLSGEDTFSNNCSVKFSATDVPYASEQLLASISSYSEDLQKDILCSVFEFNQKMAATHSYSLPFHYTKTLSYSDAVPGIGQRFLSFRQSLHYIACDFSRVLDVSPSGLKKMESGDLHVTGLVLLRLHALLGLDLNWLIFGASTSASECISVLSSDGFYETDLFDIFIRLYSFLISKDRACLSGATSLPFIDHFAKYDEKLHRFVPLGKNEHGIYVEPTNYLDLSNLY